MNDALARRRVVPALAATAALAAPLSLTSAGTASAAPAAPAALAATCNWTQVAAPVLWTTLDSSWSYLAARQAPCRNQTDNGGWRSGDVFEAHATGRGEYICRGQLTYGVGSDIWYKTDRGWSWSGGTINAIWYAGC